jgi:hypothetical protein
MATLATLFDASEHELGDLLGDTSLLVRVQELVLEMFNCGEVRAQGIHTELVEKYGAFALPGIISASYIESDRKSNAKTVTRISSLVRDVIKDNDAAQLMVFRDGIIRNPFSKSHPIFIQALLEHRFVSNPNEYQHINDALTDAQQSNNTQRVLSLYQFLVSIDANAVTRATEQCAQWLRKDYGETAAKLATTILKRYPDRTVYVVEKLFAQSYDRNSSIYSDISQHVNLSSEQAALDAMRVLIDYLVRYGQRNTTVEHFFDGPIARFIKTPQFLDAAHAMIEQSNSENVYGYWWRAVGRMTREQIVIDYMTTRLMQFCATNPDFAKAGVMQLMLLERRNPNLNWIVYYVELIAEQYGTVYADADTIVQKIMNAPRRERRERPALGTTTIRRDVQHDADDAEEDA